MWRAGWFAAYPGIIPARIIEPCPCLSTRIWRTLITAVSTLAMPAGKLTGDRAGQHGIRINQQWRICFVWTDAGAQDVEIVDYH